jgi:hypothetical protein
MGALAIIVWEALVASITRRRPVPLIFYVLGLAAAAAVAGWLIGPRVDSMQRLFIASAAAGCLAAVVGFGIIWQLASKGGQGAQRTAARVGRAIILRAIAFSTLVFGMAMFAQVL